MTTNNSGEAPLPRLRVVNVDELNQPQNKHNRRRSRRRISNNKHSGSSFITQPNIISYPLETQPILRAAIEYGRRTHALGAMRGAAMLNEIARKLRSKLFDATTIVDIALEAENFAIELHQLLSQTYEEDD